MGLAERRAAKAFETTKYPKIKEDIYKVTGYEFPIEVNWEMLSKEEYSHLYEEAWPKVYFKPLQEALKEICVDDMGKSALKEKLKKVMVTSTGSTEHSFKNGILTLDYSPISNLDYWQE